MIEEFDVDRFLAEHEIEGRDWHYIYCLYDPRTGELRYIGKSDRPRQRLANQLNEKSNTYRCHWIQELKSLGLKPIQVVIDAVPAGTDWQSVERAYIRGARAITGDRLTNGTDGGDGVPGLSDESRARIRAAWVGRKHRPDSMIKIGEASRGRRHTSEYREYMSAIMQDREFSGEHRRKIRDATQKLTADQVQEIRRLIAEGVSQYVIAERFGIHQGSVSNIARGRTYTHVPIVEDPKETS